MNLIDIKKKTLKKYTISNKEINMYTIHSLYIIILSVALPQFTVTVVNQRSFQQFF